MEATFKGITKNVIFENLELYKDSIEWKSPEGCIYRRKREPGEISRGELMDIANSFYIQYVTDQVLRVGLVPSIAINKSAAEIELQKPASNELTFNGVSEATIRKELELGLCCDSGTQSCTGQVKWKSPRGRTYVMQDIPQDFFDKAIEDFIENVYHKYVREELYIMALEFANADPRAIYKNIRIIQNGSGCMPVMTWIGENPAEYQYIGTDIFCAVKKFANIKEQHIKNEKERGSNQMTKNVFFPKIKDVKVYNNRAVVVWFCDGTFTKSVVQGEDSFDLDTGIAYCIAKRAFGKDGHRIFNNLIRDAHEAMEREEKRRIADAKEKAEIKRKNKAIKAKQLARKEAARKEKEEVIRRAIEAACRSIYGKDAGAE